MKGIFKSLRRSQKGSNESYQKVCVITNFNSCPVGRGIARMIAKEEPERRVIGVSQNAVDFMQSKEGSELEGVTPFQARLQDENERNRLIAFLKQENMKIDRIIHNQPFMLKPTPKKT